MLERMKRRGRPKKGLAQLVADRSFLARRHAELLAGAPVDDPTLAALQLLYRQAGDDRQRRRVALQFEKLCRAAPPAAVGEPDVASDVEAAEELEGPVEAAESYPEMMARIWRQPAPWRERGVDPADGHRHSNVEHLPGSYGSPYTWPPLEPPSEPG
jgi:hypothetical protein